MRKSFKTLTYKLLFIFAAAYMTNCASEGSTLMSELGWVKYSMKVDDNPLAPSINDFSLTMSTKDGAYAHTWDNIKSFPATENFHVGQYVATAISGDLRAEGYDCQCYFGTQEFAIEEGKTTQVEIAAKLYQSLINTSYDENISERFDSVCAIYHTVGHGYENAYQLDRPILTAPGETYLNLMLKDRIGRTITLNTGFSINCESNELYDVKIENDNDTILISGNGTEQKVIISEALFDAEAPTIECSGFESGVVVPLTAGYPSKENISVDVESEISLSKITLSAIGIPKGSIDLPDECDLINVPTAYTDLGLTVIKTAGGYHIDFTRLLENIIVENNTSMQFIVQATDILGCTSDLAELKVYIQGVDFSIIENHPAVIGKNIATLVLAMSQNEVQEADFKVYQLNEQMVREKELPIVASSLDETKRLLSLSFDIGKGIAKVPIEICYLDMPKVTTVVERMVPNFSFTVDAYATKAVLQVNSIDSVTVEEITRFCTVYADEAEAYITKRTPTDGTITIAGLSPQTKYNLKVVVIQGDYAANTRIETEEALQIPDGDLEDVDVLIKYDQLPSGGIYSASAFPVYNMQNFKDIRIPWMREYWASVNNKTFCKTAKNPNTWYMQASSDIDFSSYVSGNKSVRISSVGWSLDGEEIPPYKQEENMYLPYNNNVPTIEHKSAGKLYLGTYSFYAGTMTEEYVEGVKFTSRPTSLNGFYKYSPDKGTHDDAGVVKIQLLNTNNGEETVIAEAEDFLYTAPDFIAFNVPLTYLVEGVRPTLLKIFFSSSRNYGTIEEEDERVPVTANIPEAKYEGSVLWIDNLLFSY